MDRPERRHLKLAAILALAVGIFIIDIYTVPDAVSVGFLYVIPMIMTFAFDGFRVPALVAAVAATLIAVGSFIPMPPDSLLPTVLANRAISIGMVGLCLWLIHYRLLFIRALQKAIAEEKAKSAAQRAFVAMVSHEFRTPLTSIDGHAQQLIFNGPDQPYESIVHRARKMRGAVERILALVESILHSEKIEQAQLAFSPTGFDLGGLLRELAQRQRDMASGHEIDVDLSNLPEEIYGDPSLIEHVFTNLLSNAVKYSPPPARIEVAGWRQGDEAVVRVRDHGIGIPQTDLPRLFDPYFRAGNALKKPGTGVGLHLARRLVLLHHGSIAVESVENEGTTITVRLPIRPLAEGAKP